MTTSRGHEIHKETSNSELESKDIVLKKYADGGVYIRKIHNVNAEMIAINTNAEVLKDKSISTVEQLKKYFEPGTEGKIPLLPHFRFRPATLVKKGLSINIFSSFGAEMSVLIDPEGSSTFAAYWFKENMSSVNIQYGNYPLVRPGRVKDVGSINQLLQKLEELNTRRKGEEWDSYLRVYGNDKLAHNEVLLTYQANDVLGIEISKNTIMIQALRFREALRESTGRLVKFYQYDVAQGVLTVIKEKGFEDYKSSRRVTIPALKQPYNPLPVNLIDSISTDSLTQLTSSLRKFPPSKQHPIYYRFTFMHGQEQLKCKAFFDKSANVPVIKIKNKGKFIDDNVTQKISHEHYSRLLVACNDLLKDKDMKARLEVTHIAISYCPNGQYRYKPHLKLTYQPEKVESISDQKLLELIGYPADCKFERVLSDKLNEITIRLPIIQSLDSIFKALTSMMGMPLLEPLQKKRRT